jgi:putative restriction endonuclease
MDLVAEMTVRESVFRRLDFLLATSPDGVLDWEQTGERVAVAGRTYVMRQTRGRGIHRPEGLGAALSITTAFTPAGGRAPYADEIGADGFQRYKYQGTDPRLAANIALRRAFEWKLPLVYFVGVANARYRPVYPVYVIADDPVGLEFALGFEQSQVGVDLSHFPEAERRYSLRTTRQRLHQPIFREQVMLAYESTCTICQLRHAELLDAAHIVGDADEGGDPVVTNGLSLCKIHHAAYDKNLLGVTPDCTVHVNAELLQEVDGPMLRHGLQEMHGRELFLPMKPALAPDRERLKRRYEEFLGAG